MIILRSFFSAAGHKVTYSRVANHDCKNIGHAVSVLFRKCGRRPCLTNGLVTVRVTSHAHSHHTHTHTPSHSHSITVKRVHSIGQAADKVGCPRYLFRFHGLGPTSPPPQWMSISVHNYPCLGRCLPGKTNSNHGLDFTL